MGKGMSFLSVVEVGKGSVRRRAGARSVVRWCRLDLQNGDTEPCGQEGEWMACNQYSTFSRSSACLLLAYLPSFSTLFLVTRLDSK